MYTLFFLLHVSHTFFVEALGPHNGLGFFLAKTQCQLVGLAFLGFFQQAFGEGHGGSTTTFPELTDAHIFGSAFLLRCLGHRFGVYADGLAHLGQRVDQVVHGLVSIQYMFLGVVKLGRDDTFGGFAFLHVTT